jgi:glycosyltransferase involved in cell wall biosynthesis
MLQLNDALNRLGHRAVLTSTDAAGTGVLSQAERQRLAFPYDVHLHKRHRPKRLKSSIGQLAEVVSTAGQYDIMHVHGLYLAHALSAALANRISRTPYVVQLHGVLEPYQRGHSRFKKAVFDAAAGRRILRGAAGILVASDSEAEGAAAVLPPDIPIGVVPLAGGHAGPSAPAPTPAWWNIADEAMVVLFLGRLAAKKQPSLLVEAWSRTSAARGGSVLCIVGPDDDHRAADIAAAAQRLGVGDSVRTSPLVTGGEKRFLFERANLFVLPSRNENFGVTVAEALSAGTPVLTTDAVAASTHVLASKGGWVLSLDALDADNLASELDRLLASPGELRDAGERARIYAYSHLTWDDMAQRFLAFYEKILCHTDGLQRRGR